MLALLALVVSLYGGCSRSHYRRQADTEAYALVNEKANHPHWPLDNYTIDVNPGSRMFDPYSPDRPPMPQDDPAAHQLMHAVDGKRAWPWWHVNGETRQIENPAWLAYLPTDERGVLQVDSDESVRLALLHSPDFQSQLEELYLSALDVSFERFRFDTQFFAGHATNFITDGPLRSGGGGDSSSTLGLATNPGARGIRGARLGATGADMVVGLANSIVWQFAGPESLDARTLLDFSMVQPLLRSAGRDRVLERLTIAERALLANVRQMEQFRRGFYLEITTGRDAGQGPSRRGGVFGGSGLQGFTGTGAGGFGRLGGGGAGGFGGGGGGTGAGAAGAGGFIGLLQNRQEIRNLEFNIEGLRTNLYQLSSFRDAAHTFILTTETPAQRAERILREELQVAQAQQALNNAEGQLLNARNAYEQSLDSFKSDLGLPPQICLQVNDPLLDQFKLISDETRRRQTEINDLMLNIGAANDAILRLAKSEVVLAPEGASIRQTLQWSDELEQQLQQLQQHIEPLGRISESIAKDNLPPAAADLERFKEVLPRRQEALRNLLRAYECRRQQLCPLLPTGELDKQVFNGERLGEVRDELEQELKRLQGALGNYSQQIDELRKEIERVLQESKKRELDRGAPDSVDLYNEIVKLVDPETRELRPGVTLRMQTILSDVSDDTFSLQLLQARARSESIELVPVQLSADTAFEIARRFRRDWMNARGSLVDSWRLIQFNADDLKSGLDVVFSGDMANVGDNPLDLRATTGRMRVGLQFDAPLTRIGERNTYRQALIEFQQARRSYYQFRDAVAAGLRAELRTLEANAINFELRRSAVRTAAQQIVINDAILESRAGQASGATAARDTVSALSDLQSAQNDFLSVWVNYEVLRRSLDFDLGTMEIDHDGIWLDPGQIGDEDPCEGCVCDLPPLDGEPGGAQRESVAPGERRPPGEMVKPMNRPPLIPPPPLVPPPTMRPLPEGAAFDGAVPENAFPQPEEQFDGASDERLQLYPTRIRLTPPLKLDALPREHHAQPARDSEPDLLPVGPALREAALREAASREAPPRKLTPFEINTPLAPNSRNIKAARLEPFAPADIAPANPLRNPAAASGPLRE